MRRNIRGVLSFVIVVLLISVIEKPEMFDSLILLEWKYPGYCEYILEKANSFVIDNKSEAYLITNVTKDGFGAVTPDDISFFLRNINRVYPNINKISIRFRDGTGIEISANKTTLAKYGIMDTKGNVEKEFLLEVDLKRPLINQIPDFTYMEREYDNRGNVVYQFRKDGNNRGVADLNGVAGFYREYSMPTTFFLLNESNVIREQYIGVDNLPVINAAKGYAEVRRIYENNKPVKELYFGVNCEPQEMMGGYYGITQKWDKDVLIERTYLDDNGNPVERNDGYSKVIWRQGEDGVWNEHFFDLDNNEVIGDGLNLVKDISYGVDGWSKWMTPTKDVVNSCFTIGRVNLGDKKEADVFTCSVEIEFKNVTSKDNQKFLFLAQGAQDGEWTTGNIWNGQLVYLTEAPENGIYDYTYTMPITSEMAIISWFEIGFRCDHWGSGSFRIKNLKIEKGESASEWSPGI